MQVYRRFLIAVPLVFGVLLAGLLFMSACSPKRISGQGKILLPWPNPTGGYELQAVELHTLQEPSSLTGDAATILVDPRLSTSGLRGDRPSARFVETNEGVMVPADFMSAQMAGLYAHAEKLWELDRLIGVENSLARPRKVGIKRRTNSDIVGKNIRKNNALYSADHDAIIVMPYDGSEYSETKRLPLSLNAGIIAHEHFHALFHSFLGTSLEKAQKGSFLDCNFAHQDQHPKGGVLWNNKNKNIDLNNEMIIAGFNEGFADLWAWIYTGDDDFIAHSLPQLKSSRSLQVAGLSIGSVDSTSDYINAVQSYRDLDARAALPYRLGTQLARQIRIRAYNQFQAPLAGSLSVQQRIQIGQVIISMLPEISDVVLSTLDQKGVLDTQLPLVLFDKLSTGLK